MKSFLPLLAACATALPTTDPDPIRILPANWRFTIQSLYGPGCPDLSTHPSFGNPTRLTYGQNTMDGSEIYYWFIAYPYMRVDMAGNERSWCEAEIGYQEFSDGTQTKESSDYRLRVHKNGTRVIATYKIDEGVMGKFVVTYDEGGDKKTTDTITWKGPIASGQYQKEASSPVVPGEIYKLPKCGAGTIKFRTDLSVEGPKDSSGFVASETIKDDQGVVQYYGLQQGWSYDWEKCKE